MAVALGIGVAGFGWAGSAQATAIAFAENMITNFAITSSAGSSIALLGTPQRNTRNSANFTGASSIATQAPVTLGSPSDALQAYSGTGVAPSQNNYAFLAGSSAGMVGARGDSNTSAGSPFAPGGVPVISNVAEGRVSTGSGSAGASGGVNTANAAISFAFTLGGPGTITFSFDDLYRYFASTDVNGEGAQGSLANVFTITDASGATVFNYADPLINTHCGSNSGVPLTYDSGLLSAPVAFSSTSGLLSAGSYTISLTTSSTVTVASAAATIPEPGSVSLLGIGVGALGFTMRRRKPS